MIYLFLLGLGLIVGSFLNVIALRLRSGLTLGGRSKCFTCGKTLGWWELVPVISFFMLKGRCSQCKTRISWQYPLVEIVTALVFVSLYQVFGLNLLYTLNALIFSIYIVICVYDVKHKIIPDGLVYVSILLSLLVPIFFIHFSLFDWLVGPALALFLALIWLFSRGRALGLGDAKLTLSIGFLLGGAQTLSAFAMAFWIGTLVTLPILLLGMLRRRKGLTMKSEIPFAPFLILGAWVSLYFSLDIFHALSF